MLYCDVLIVAEKFPLEFVVPRDWIFDELSRRTLSFASVLVTLI